MTALDAEKHDGALPGTVQESKKEPGPNSAIHTAKVRMTAPGVLLFKMNYHPGWHALVDGHEVETQMVVPSFTAIRLSAGEHEIRFSYEVAPLKRVLLYVTMLGLLGLAPFLLLTRRKG
ncbi:MAG: YfhO family protein [Deltaproteobacteria bacterium]|nr:YfhO family protein [Deltaproteobacteria bacterium]